MLKLCIGYIDTEHTLKCFGLVLLMDPLCLSEYLSMMNWIYSTYIKYIVIKAVYIHRD